MNWKNVIAMQGVVMLYTISSVMAKCASANKDNLFRFLVFFGLEFVLLGVYAVFWQQIIKHFDLTVAYANRAMAIFWSMIWAVVFFHDEITGRNIAGVALVILGMILVNTEEKKHV